ncbi:MAG: N-acetylmuramoyl-L-alanine amidase [Burkholderiales bacterium]
MLKIENHRLVGDRVTFRETPNHGGVLKARYLVMHYTAGSSLQSSVTSLCTRKPSGNASAHLVLGRDGAIVQLAPFDVVTWHAGISQWNGQSGLNNFSVGIEMDNAGILKRVGSKFVAWFGKEYPESEVVLAAHKHGGGVQPWHAYPESQIARALELAELLVEHYGLEDVLGHEDIAPGRKTDPGPAFPLEAIRSRALGRDEDEPPHYVVTATSLNIRKGPDASFEPVAPALRKGTGVTLLEAGARWSKVEVDGPTDIEGWVNNAFIEKVASGASGTRAIAPKKPTNRAPNRSGPATAGRGSTTRRKSP